MVNGKWEMAWPVALKRQLCPTPILGAELLCSSLTLVFVLSLSSSLSSLCSFFSCIQSVHLKADGYRCVYSHGQSLCQGTRDLLLSTSFITLHRARDRIGMSAACKLGPMSMKKRALVLATGEWQLWPRQSTVYLTVHSTLSVLQSGKRHELKGELEDKRLGMLQLPH